jgi:hypothetical protein
VFVSGSDTYEKNDRRQAVVLSLEAAMSLNRSLVSAGLAAAMVAALVISATELAPFGTKHFAIPFDATGKAWVRFAVWDSAGDGAFVQPAWVSPKAGQTTSSR